MGVPMTVAMMQVGIVRVSMEHGFMPVPMAVRLSRMHVGAMSVLVVVVVAMPMLVLQRLVGVFVFMPLCEMEP